MASDDRRVTSGLAGWLLVQAALLGAAAGAEEQAPDLDLLAYLGSWDGGDEEWVAVAEWDGKTDSRAPEEPEPQQEKDDE